MSGVTVFGVEDGRLYIGEVEPAGEDIDETVHRPAGPTRRES
jgi:hypothetical protein